MSKERTLGDVVKLLIFGILILPVLYILYLTIFDFEYLIIITTTDDTSILFPFLVMIVGFTEIVMLLGVIFFKIIFSLPEIFDKLDSIVLPSITLKQKDKISKIDDSEVIESIKKEFNIEI